jgi:hypothetical protein
MSDSTSSSRARPESAQPDSLTVDESLAKSWIALAQMGQSQQAGVVLQDLRSRYSKGDSPRITIRVLILEAVAWYYDNRRPDSLDRARRALALSTAARISDLAAEAAVWVSHLSFNFDDYALLSSALKTSFEGFECLDAGSRGRVCLVVADSSQFLGHPEIASRWYTVARIFARQAKSRSLIAAIEYNRIVMGLSRLRLERFFPIHVEKRSSKAWIGDLLSIQRLHEGLGVTSLKELLLLCEALAHQADSNFSLAAVAMTQIRSKGAAQTCGLSERMLDLEIDWCRVLSEPASVRDPSVLPTIEELEQWSFGEQVVALRQLDDISRALDLPIDREKIEALHKVAVNQCLADDGLLSKAIEASQSVLTQIEQTAGASGG